MVEIIRAKCECLSFSTHGAETKPHMTASKFGFKVLYIPVLRWSGSALSTGSVKDGVPVKIKYKAETKWNARQIEAFSESIPCSLVSTAFSTPTTLRPCKLAISTNESCFKRRKTFEEYLI
jgi:hypothetical protein